MRRKIIFAVVLSVLALGLASQGMAQRRTSGTDKVRKQRAEQLTRTAPEMTGDLEQTFYWLAPSWDTERVPEEPDDDGTVRRECPESSLCQRCYPCPRSPEAGDCPASCEECPSCPVVDCSSCPGPDGPEDVPTETTTITTETTECDLTLVFRAKASGVEARRCYIKVDAKKLTEVPKELLNQVEALQGKDLEFAKMGELRKYARLVKSHHIQADLSFMNGVILHTLGYTPKVAYEIIFDGQKGTYLVITTLKGMPDPAAQKTYPAGSRGRRRIP